MPKVSIREIDNTGTETLEYFDYTVLIPGPKLYYQVAIETAGDTSYEYWELEHDHTYSDISELNSKILTTSNEHATPLEKTEEAVLKDLGYLMFYELLNQGLSVEYYPSYEITEYGIVSLITDYAEFYAQFEDKGKYDLRFITIGGLCQTNDVVNASNEALRCAGNRGDASAILSVPSNGSFNQILCYLYNDDSYITVEDYNALSDTEKEKCTACYGFGTFRKTLEPGVYAYKSSLESGDEGYVSVILTLGQYNALSSDDQKACAALLDAPEDIALNTSIAIDNWVNENLSVAYEKITRNGVSWKNNKTETYGQYGSILSPDCVINFYINDKDVPLTVPASFIYLSAFAKHIKNYKSWYAMAGSVRGTSAYDKINPVIKFGDADINNVFQVRDGGVNNKNENHLATNVIYEVRPYGNIIWGNRTLHPLGKPNKTDKAYAIQLIASDFFNIRQLCCDIKKALYRAAKKFTFEPNSDALWYNFKGAITPLLEDMKNNRGIMGYQVIKVKTNKKGVLAALIRIRPIEAVEDFDLTVELTDSIEVAE